MPPQTLKRQAEDVSFRNDDLVDDVYNNEKWGSKKSRFHYTSSLQSESNLFKNINDSDQAESGHSFQSTIEVVEKLDFSSDSSCENDSNTDYSCQSCSSHSDITDFEVSKNVVLLSNDNGYLPEDSIDIKLSTPETKVLYPCFKTCLMCKKNNTNPFFQFCNKCFRYRMQLFESYPDPQPKSIKRLNIMVNHAKESNVHKASSTSNSQGSGSFGISDLCLSQETDKSENFVNVCNICFIRTKDGLFNHGKTSHMYSCYSCAKLIWGRTGKCPICNVKIKSVTKIFNESF